MFLLVSKKLEGQSLVDAVKVLQDHASKRTEKNVAFSDLRDTFKGLIEKKIHSVIEVAESKSERDDIRHHVETSFFQILTELTPKSAPEIVGYIAKGFSTKVNRQSIKNLLGKGNIVSDIEKYKYRFKNALRDFYKQYKRMPDFNKIDLDSAEDESDDIDKFKKILKTTEEQTLEILKLFGQGTMKSMYDEVAGDDENALILMDTLKSDEPLPDEVLEDKQLVETVKKEIKNLSISDFNAESQKRIEKDLDKVKKVLMIYYRIDNPQADELKSDQVAEKIYKEEYEGKSGETLDQIKRKTRDWISEGRRALEKSPILKKLYVESMSKVFVKMAINKYKTAEDLVFEVVSSQCE
jgi:hypothetical protein